MNRRALKTVLASALVPLLVAAPIQQTELPTMGIVAIIGLLVFSLGVHEAAHAQTALWCGDPTARDLGRITLDPRAHIDLMMSIVMPLILYVTTGFAFGGAKPVPVNFARLRKPLRDMALVAIAGPLSNILLAIFFASIYAILRKNGVYSTNQAMLVILDATVSLNILLAIFNLVPIPPLDGSRVMAWLLPQPLRAPYALLEVFGLFIVFGLIVFVPGFFRLLLRGMRPVENFVYDIANWVGDLLMPITSLFS